MQDQIGSYGTIWGHTGPYRTMRDHKRPKGTKRQGGDSSAGTQALPVGKIIEAKVFRKDNLEISQTYMWCK